MALFEHTEERISAQFRHERFAPEEDNARSRLLRVRQDLRKVQIVGQDDIAMLAGIIADLSILRRHGIIK